MSKSRTLMASRLLCLAALASAVRPCLFSRSRFGQQSHTACTTSRSPARAAASSAVSPVCVSRSRVAPLSIRLEHAAPDSRSVSQTDSQSSSQSVSQSVSQSASQPASQSGWPIRTPGCDLVRRRIRTCTRRSQ
eukprot:1185932-Prorocentrum_minimum.AAC.4